MRLFPLHVILKDFLLFALYIFFSKDFGQTTVISAAWLSLIMMRGFILMNLLIQTILYFSLKRHFQFNSIFKNFFFGVILHIPTLIIWTTSLQNEEPRTPVIISSTISCVLSGLIYVLINLNKKFTL